jgi:hypothetical protein
MQFGRDRFRISTAMAFEDVHGWSFRLLEFVVVHTSVARFDESAVVHEVEIERDLVVYSDAVRGVGSVQILEVLDSKSTKIEPDSHVVLHAVGHSDADIAGRCSHRESLNDVALAAHGCRHYPVHAIADVGKLHAAFHVRARTDPVVACRSVTPERV